MKVKPYLTLFIGVAAISFAAIFIRLAEAPPLVIATYRLTLASVILVPIASAQKVKSFKGILRRHLFLMFLASILIAVHFWLWITSLAYTSIASSVILVTSHPVFVAIVSYLLWGEKLNKVAVSGILVALTGVVLVNVGGLEFSKESLRGDILALVAGLAMGIYLIIGRGLRTRIDVLPYLVITYSMAAAVLIILTLSTGHSLFGYSAITYLMMLLLALVPQLIGHSCLNISVRLLPATVVSVAILGEPVGATLLGFLILKQTPTFHEVAGGLLILSGIYLTTVQGNKTDKGKREG